MMRMKLLKDKIYLLLSLLFIACGNKTEDISNSKQLECILDQFIEISEIKTNHHILIGYIDGVTTGHEKNELLIRIQNVENNFPSTYYHNNLYVANYREFTLYASFDFLKKGDITPNVSAIPNTLEWEKVEIEKKTIVYPDTVEPFYDFEEIQIIYNYKTKKIIDSRSTKGEIIEITCNE